MLVVETTQSLSSSSNTALSVSKPNKGIIQFANLSELSAKLKELCIIQRVPSPVPRTPAPSPRQENSTGGQKQLEELSKEEMLILLRHYRVSYSPLMLVFLLM